MDFPESDHDRQAADTLPKPTAASDGDAVVAKHAKQESQDARVRETARWVVALERVPFQLSLRPNLLAAANRLRLPRLGSDTHEPCSG
jgi:hypothetical protein